MTEHPDAEQLQTLRAAGWVVGSTLDGIHCSRPDVPGLLPWQAALDFEDDEDQAA